MHNGVRRFVLFFLAAIGLTGLTFFFGVGGSNRQLVGRKNYGD